jgi:NhaP-type Na+/H+ or K+/H+ antiporter
MTGESQIAVARFGLLARLVSSARADRFITFFAAVVFVQGVHVFEHVVQLIQVFILHIPEDRALGLLGEVAEIQGTEEWLHLAFNSLYLLALCVIAAGLLRRRSIPVGPLAVFLTFGVGVEAWHIVEHGVIISHVVANNGCPCPGILDVRLGTGDAIIHFFYNAIAYAGTLVAYWYAFPKRNRPAPA